MNIIRFPRKSAMTTLSAVEAVRRAPRFVYFLGRSINPTYARRAEGVRLGPKREDGIFSLEDTRFGMSLARVSLRHGTLSAGGDNDQDAALKLEKQMLETHQQLEELLKVPRR